MTLTALVVDDEPAARAGLAAMVRTHGSFSDVRECGDRDTAARIIRTQRPHLVLLDIQLNPGTGFDVIEQVGPDAMPPVLFVTAFERFALKAFEANAIDYVLKPVDPERLGEALARAQSRIAHAGFADAGARIAALVSSLHTPALRQIPISDGDRTLVFEPNEIPWIRAADYYAEVCARGKTWLVRETLDALEARIPSPPFFRVHRSAIVNLRHVTEVTRTTRHRHVVILRDGSQLPVSEERRTALDAWLWAAAKPRDD